MPVSIGIVSYRLPSLTPQEFKVIYETKHVPLVLSFTNEDSKPISYRRHYLNRSAEGQAALIVGDPERADWDCFVEVMFRDEEHFQKFLAAHSSGIEAIQKHEDTFVDRKKVLVGTYATEGF